MFVLLLSLLALCIVAFFAGAVRNRRLQKQLRRGEIAEMPHIRKRPDGCCGQHAVCEKEELLKAAGKPVEYFDDEELDRFADRPSNEYAPDEVEQFEEVLTTMRPQEIPAWLSSLQLRRVNVPDDLKDEVMLLMEQSR